MKNIMLAATVCAGIAAASSQAFADRWVEPNNGAVSAITMPDGDVMLKVQIPSKEFAGIGRDMKAGKDVTCKLKEVYPGTPNTMILVCG